MEPVNIVLIAKDWGADFIAPTTKKNRPIVNRRTGRVFPNARYTKWLASLPANSRYDRRAPAITARVNVRALVYRKANIGDADGYYNAIGDALQCMGIIANDRQIAHWDGSRLLKDAAFPRVEIELTEAL